MGVVVAVPRAPLVKIFRNHHWLEHLPHNRKVVGSSPGRVIQKTLRMVLAAFSSGARHMRKEWGS